MESTNEAQTLQRLKSLVNQCCGEQRSSATLQLQIEDFCHKWKEIDSMYLTTGNKEKDWRTAAAIALSMRSEDPSTMNQDHLRAVRDLFEQALSATQYHKSTVNSGIWTAMAKYVGSRAEIQADLSTLPEIEISERLKKSDVAGSEPEVDADEWIYTFAVYNARTQQLHQRLEALGGQSLATLVNAIYCVQDSFQEMSEEDNRTLMVNNISYCAHSDPHGTLLFQRDSTNMSTLPPQVHSSFNSSLFAMSSGNANDAAIIRPPPKRPRRSMKAAAAAASALLHRNHNIHSQLPNPTSSPPAMPTDASVVHPSNQMASSSHDDTNTHASADTRTSAAAPLQHQREHQLQHPSVCLYSTPIALCSWQWGQSCLYTHIHGCCSHLLVPLDRRKHTPRSLDSISLASYPRELYRTTFRRRRCQVCEAFSAQQVTFHDRLAETNPAYFCRPCFELLHYDAHGNLLYDDFYSFPYLHDT